MKHAGGRPAEPEREAWAMRFGLSWKKRINILTDRMIWQLSRCRSDEARRLLLGVSR